MRVKELMTRDVHTCDAGCTLERAVQLMWEGDCGAIPVVDAHGHLFGIVTDRDASIAAYTQGKPLGAISVASAMAHQVHTCNLEDSVAHAAEIMRHAQVHRLPVVNNLGELVGILSLSDLVRGSQDDPQRGALRPAEVAHTLAAVCLPRQPEDPIVREREHGRERTGRKHTTLATRA